MPELCRSCDRKAIDFGGCRCHTMALAGDASATDPVYIRSRLRERLTEQAETDSVAEPPPFVYRRRQRETVNRDELVFREGPNPRQLRSRPKRLKSFTRALPDRNSGNADHYRMMHSLFPRVNPMAG